MTNQELIKHLKQMVEETRIFRDSIPQPNGNQVTYRSTVKSCGYGPWLMVEEAILLQAIAALEESTK
jgi:hypothetical protein